MKTSGLRANRSETLGASKLHGPSLKRILAVLEQTESLRLTISRSRAFRQESGPLQKTANSASAILFLTNGQFLGLLSELNQ